MDVPMQVPKTFAALVAPLAILLAGCLAQTAEPDGPVDPNASAADGDDPGETSDELSVKRTFANTDPLLVSACGGCHKTFGILDVVKANRTKMIAKISAGQMPKGNPTWRTTADGKAVLKWLRTGADLK